MLVQRVEDPADPRLRDFTGLTDGSLRRLREPAEGLFIAEGEKVILRALAAGYLPRAVLTEDRWLPGLEAALAGRDVAVYLAGRDLLEQVTGYQVHRGALAAMARSALPTPAEVLQTSTRVVVLEDIVNHTNLGAILRAAAGLGVDGVLLTPRSADPLYRRSVKVSMGSVFALPWARFEQWPECFELVRTAGFRLIGLTPSPDAVPLPDLAPGARDAVLLGTEGEGLSPQALAACDVRVQIPMRAGVDSLNVAAAAAVAFYALAHPRAAPAGAPA